MQITIKNNWDDVTWKEYEQIRQVIDADIPADYKAVVLISILTGKTEKDIEYLPINIFQQLVKQLEFLYAEPKKRLHKFDYTVNGREYIFNGLVNTVTTAQYIDYRTYIQGETVEINKLFSCFLIPKGHEYNDGYDMQQVWDDIDDMCWLDVDAAAFFFTIQFAASILTSKLSLMKTLKKERKNKKTRDKVKQLEDHFNNMAWCLLSSRSVPKHTLRLIS